MEFNLDQYWGSVNLPEGYLIDFSKSLVRYRFRIDEFNDTAFFFVTVIHRIGQEDLYLGDSFAFVLHFLTETSGTYELLGQMGRSSCYICEDTGPFVIEDLPAD